MNANGTGLVILGSQDERHGRLPRDIDTKLAAHVALKASARTGARLVGIVNKACEQKQLNHGRHFQPEEVLKELEEILWNAREALGIQAYVIVNGHGGNKLIETSLPELERRLEVRIILNSSIVELEGAHAGSGECSMAVAAGLAQEEELRDQGDFERYPEVGFVGMEKLCSKTLTLLAEKTRREGVRINVEDGERLIELAVQKVVADIQRATRQRP